MRTRLLLVCFLWGAPAFADQVSQFGVIDAASFRMGGTLTPGHGSDSQTLVIANLGTTVLNFDAFNYSATLLFTDTHGLPSITPVHTPGGIALAPGQAYGYINGDFQSILTLDLVQGYFPTIQSLIVDPNNVFRATFANPLDNNNDFSNTTSLVQYQLQYGALAATWTEIYQVGVPGLQPGGTVGVTLSNRQVSYEKVAEPSSLVLSMIGLLAIAMLRSRRS